MSNKKIENMFFDYRQGKWKYHGIGITLTACTAHNGTGTMWVITKNKDISTKTDDAKCSDK